MDFLLEVVMLPVADVDRAKAFYADRAGFRLDVDHRAGDTFRVVQLTPPGSSCSIVFGLGLADAAAGSVRGTHLVVTDVVAACRELADRGLATDPIHHFGASGRADGPHPDRVDFGTFSGFADPDGNTWVLQERGYRA